MSYVTETIDGIVYTLGKYSFGKEAEINDKSIKVEIDPISRRPVPITLAGTMRMLSVCYSIKKWTFRGVNDDGILITDESVQILPINEFSVRNLPNNHGKKLSEVAGKLNGMDEEETKNS